MTSQENHSETAADPSAGSGQDLRQKAEAAARERAARTPEDSAALSPEEIQKSLHELRVHQIELEMQNEELRTAQAEIEAGRARYIDLYDLAPAGYCTLSEQGLILEANLTVAALLGTTRGLLVKQPISRFILKDDQDIYYLHRKKLFETGERQECELRLVKPGGAFIWAHLTATAAQAQDGAPMCRVVIIDITNRKMAEAKIIEREKLLSWSQEITHFGSWKLDLTANRLTWSDEVYRIFGCKPQEFAATYEAFLDFVHPDDQAAMDEAYSRSLREGSDGYESVHRIVRRNSGEVRYVHERCVHERDDAGAIIQSTGMVTDITERKRGEEEIRRIAYYDPLTHLPNRTFFLDQLRRTLALAKRSNRRAALLFCDLDNFKDVNDTLGHDKGDQLLKGIAERLSTCVRGGDTLSRLGGDEFVLLLPSVKADRDAVMVARKIKEQLAKPFDLDGNEVYTSPSIGIAFFPDDGETVNTLLKHADMAMYAAKARGRNRYHFFSEDMNTRVFERMQLEAGLRQACERQEFRIVYQPVYRLATGRLESVEALLRWRHSERGYIPPARFIPLAEETGLIHEIGAWVMRSACVQVKEWLDAGYPGLRVAVNLSARQFAEPGLVETVRGVLVETGLPASVLELEITESVLMHDADLAVKTIEALRADGVGLTIDDFGAGYSSLKYLKNIPVNRLKIDKAFVNDIARDPRDTAIVAAIIELGRSLGLDVVAEGVETPSQAAVLRRLKCPMVQGFYFARPQTREAMTRRLAAKA